MTWKRLSYLEAFRLVFSGENEVGQLLRRCVGEYSMDLGLSPAMLPVLVVRYLISRILLLQSIGNPGSCDDAVSCLQGIADGHLDVGSWRERRLIA